MDRIIELLRQQAIEGFQAGVAAADPGKAVARCLRFQHGHLEILQDSGSMRSEPWQHVHILAFGKAACAMAAAALRIIPESLRAGDALAVTNYENQIELPHCQVMGAGHPLPDPAGQEAARVLAERVSAAAADDLVLVLVSGGASALLPYPPTGITLTDKIAVTQRLLACGADIGQMNCVRKHLSLLKGGGLARLAPPADLHALILSDVIGDDLSAIASGPTVADATTYADAIQVLRTKNIWTELPESVRYHLRQGCHGVLAETPKPEDPLFATVGNTLVASNSISLQALTTTVATADRPVKVFSTALCGEAREEAESMVLAAAEKLKAQADASFALVAGGETTVTLRGQGRGGRNQELALAFAIAAEKHGLPKRWVFLSGGSDGRDGPTDAAGGLVDPWTLERMRQAGQDPLALLADNDAYHALDSANDLLRIGATGTNVADLQVLLMGGG